METSNSIATRATDTSANSTTGSALMRLAALPARLDDETLAQVDSYAKSPPPALPKTDETHVAQFMRMMSDMPRQHTDTATGQVKVENMLRHLGHLPRATLNWMMDQVHKRFTFHPSIKELLDLAAEWTRNDEAVQARAKAEVLARREREQRLDDARRALLRGELDQAGIDALPQRFVDILETQGLLRREVTEDGARYTARPQPQLPDADKGPADFAELRERLDARFASQRGDA